MAKIAFEDKISLVTNDLPINGKLTADNANEIKNSVNALYDTAVWTVELDSGLIRSFSSPASIKIMSIESSVVQTVSIKVNAVTYTLGDDISQWDVIEITGEYESTVNLLIESAS